MTDSSENDLLSLFWIEVSEYLPILNNGMLKVEMAKGQERIALLREMNRVAHSMKGAARAVGMGVVQTVAHYMEEVFQLILKDGAEFNPNSADSLYDGLDLIQSVMDGRQIDTDVINEVVSSLEHVVAVMSGAEVEENGEDELELEDPIGEDGAIEPVRSTQTGSVHPFTTVRLDDDSREVPAIRATGVTPSIKHDAILSTSMLTAEINEMAPTLLLRPVEETIRVTVSKLDRLMAEASELLVAQMQGEERAGEIDMMRRRHARWLRDWRNVRAAYIRLVRRIQDQGDRVPELTLIFKFLEANQRYLSEFGRELSRLGQSLAADNMHLSTLSDQLQDDIASMRMMPFETIMGSFQRMTRDLARELGKQVNLVVEGAAVEIDKTVLDALSDPMLHLIRNAIDHGLESPHERETQGKSPVGQIVIGVEQRGSEIVLRVTDDGAGLNLDRIRRKAIKAELLNTQQAEVLSDEEIRMLIFHPGFSTSDAVTAVSGRGLGMDIVRTRVESLRGQVSIASKPGSGTTVTLRVPVSLTRLRCIIFRVGDEEFAVPSAVVIRMETILRDNIFTAEGKDMLNLNDRPMPLVSMGALLNIPTTGSQNNLVQIMALEAAGRLIAFEVDELISEVELVLKPLGPELQQSPYVAGAALLGTGGAIIILDANDLVRGASGSALPQRRMSLMGLPSGTSQRRLRVLVVDDSITTRTLEKNILETAGFEVHVAIDGVEAWTVINNMDFDIIISDVEMPNMNGLELTQRIKTHSQTQHTPVILLTSLNKPEQREAGLRAGANAYLIKSQFDQGELLETIQSVL